MDRLKTGYDAIASKEQMLAIVSHDIKNPLSAIQLETQLLIRAAERSGKSVLSEEVKIQAGRILKTTDRLKTLISDLLEKNKSESGLTYLQKSEVDLKKLFQDVVDALRPLSRDKGQILKVTVPEHECVLFLDRNKMFQVLSNLINNAIKFTPKAGVIHLNLESRADDFVFYVSDSGPGMNESDLPHVFEKYWCSKSQNSLGTGLGLFICKTIIEAHKGQITAQNLPQSGALFTFNLPKCSQRKIIYVVDDDDDLRDVICWALEKEGYTIYPFQSPLEALESLVSCKHRPHLFLVDFHMDEMKGNEFVQRKNELGLKECPSVMISATPKDIENKELYREIITKPIDLTGLVENIKLTIG
ncbi:ATP-binding protein [Peredibacter sp. HCB2-198]|uniref:hybrid sensor histidine kinase/response regulator n=1 Tax=Peredibacter sp. HCB2-198 TaxID=3383025 RepID=UPI0038B44169